MPRGLQIRATPQPCSPTSGFTIMGKVTHISFIFRVAARTRAPQAEWGSTRQNSATGPPARSIHVRVVTFDSPTVPPVAIPGFAAVNTVGERWRIMSQTTYGTRGTYASQFRRQRHRDLWLLGTTSGTVWLVAIGVIGRGPLKLRHYVCELYLNAFPSMTGWA